MRRAARWGMLTAWALCMAAPGVATAADDQATREAEARFSEGLSRVKTHDFEAARLSFAQAYAVLRRPLILWNLALAEEKTGHALEALQHFRRVVGEADGALDRANAQKHVDMLMGQTARIDVKAPPGVVLVLDGGGTLTAPLAEPLDVMPGRHVLDAKLSQGAQSFEVDAAAGQVAHVSFMPLEGPSPAATPAVSLPPPAPQSPPDVRVAEGARADVAPPSQSFWTPRTVTAVAVGGAAVVTLGLGVYFGLASEANAGSVSTFQTQHTAPNTCHDPVGALVATCKQWDSDLQTENRDAAVSNVFYVAGGILSAVAIATWFLWPKDAHGTEAWVLPQVGPTGAGLVSGGRF
jgi:hypothetical protein